MLSFKPSAVTGSNIPVRIKNALFCIPCLLFTDEALKGEHQRLKQGNAFTNEGFSRWKKQFEGVAKHEASSCHRSAVVAQALFLQGQTVQSSLSKNLEADAIKRKTEVARNRSIVKRIVDTIVFLGGQGLSLRGHRETLTSNVVNGGNFLEALKFLSMYDPTMQQHLSNVQARQCRLAGKGRRGRGSHLNFMSNDTQNKLVSIISQQITKTIVIAIEECRAWAIIVDTTPDVTSCEQVSICVRIVHINGTVSEHLLAIQKANSTTAENIFDVLFSTLQSKDVSFNKLVAQAYDGASNMSGCYNGLQALVHRRINSNVIYVHCYAHTLNLVLSDTAAVAIDTVTLFGNLEVLYVLFRKSLKAHAVFEDVQRSEGLEIRSLKRLNTTRWSSREMCIKSFIERHKSIVLSLERIQDDTTFDGKQRSEAAGLLLSINTKQFLATLYLFHEVFGRTGPLSRYLQSTHTDFSNAMTMVNAVVTSLEQMRENVGEIIRIMEQAVGDFDNVAWKPTRVCYCRTTTAAHSSNAVQDTETPLEAWERNTFYVVIDTILGSLIGTDSK